MRNNFEATSGSGSGSGSGVGSPAILNAFAILECFDAQSPVLSLSELSRRLGIAKASTFRNLNALEHCGYVVRNERDGTYSLGVRVLDLARRFSEKDRFLSAGAAHIRELSRATGETSHLAILDGADIVYVDVSEGSQLIRAVVRRGDRLPAHCVASGKAILAHSPDERVMAFLARGLAALTHQTLTSPDALLTDFEAVRSRGYATNVGEWAEDVSAVSVPVFAQNQAVVGAIGIAGPRPRLGVKMLAYFATAIQAQAQRFSAELGADLRRADGSERSAHPEPPAPRRRRRASAA